MHEQRALYKSMRNTREHCRERWWLRVLQAKRYVDVEEDEEETQATAGGTNSASFVPPLPQSWPVHA